ncbi:MAG: hypothetical protein IKD55_00560 [Sediminibacterium sp.]|nr:hypothetical protein [Sediminibacterium sp.]MBX9781217.1 hypothetical protein [Chitinophagaceae bacterium]
MKTEQLPPFVLAELYPHSLVLVDTVAPIAGPAMSTPKELPVIEQEKKGLHILGNNAKKICIVVEDHSAVFLSDSDLQFLTNVLGACKLNMGDVALINSVHSAVDIALIKKELNPSYCLLFGMDTDTIGLPFKIPLYQQQSYANCQFLVFPDFPKFSGSTEEAKLEKTRLWVSLKKLLNI